MSESRDRLLAFVIAGGVVAYMAFALWRGWFLITSGDPVAIGLGLAVAVLPAVGAWLLFREIRFGLQMQRMGRQLAAEGDLALDDLPRTPSGRVDRDAADARFTDEQLRVQEQPGDWRGWYRLAVAYDDARDRKRARAAMREAIRLRQS